MKEMTDQELTDKISQVFENFEDPSAEYGWQELRKKYPEKHTRPILLWWGAAAAVLLMICGMWFLVPNTEIGEQKIAGGKTESKTVTGNYNQETEAISKDSLNISNSHAAHKSDISPATDSARLLTYSKEDHANSLREENKHSVVSSTGIPKNSTVDVLSSPSTQVLLIAASNPNQTPLVGLPQPEKPELNSLIAKADRDSAVNASAKMLALAQTAADKDDHLHRVEELPYASQKISSKNNMISFYAGSYVNYALGSETKVNFGAGFTSDIKLGNNLRLSTGLALANNSLTYNNGVPSTGKEKLSFDLPNSFVGNGNNNLTTVTKYDASLLALDIPLNIKYLLIPKDNTLYMLAGLSSGTYLNEKYSLSYRNYSTAGAYVGQAQGSTVKNQFQGFDFARTLNISFGFSTNLSKTQNITIEPFLKYPLGGLGSEDLRFGSTGLNLKLNFSRFKK